MGTAMEKYRKKMAEKANQYADEEKTGSNFITTRGGILTYGEEELPGNEMLVIILDAIHENTFYPDKFDPDFMLPPKCFAFNRVEKDLQPHENVLDEDDEGAEDSFFELQAEWCDECPHAEWGSADTGRGKACTNRRRLAIIPAGRFVQKGKKTKDTEMEVFDDPAHFRAADIAFLKLPVTSTKNWSKYVHGLNKEFQVPPFAVLTHVYLRPDPKTQFKVFFDCIEVIEDEDILKILFDRNEEAMEAIEQPYAEPTAEELEKPKAKAKTGLSGLCKKKRR